MSNILAAIKEKDDESEDKDNDQIPPSSGDKMPDEEITKTIKNKGTLIFDATIEYSLSSGFLYFE